MAKKQFNLETELTGKIDDLTAKLNRANQQIGNFKNQQKKNSADLSDAFKGTSSAIKDVGSAISSGGITSLPALFSASKTAISSATSGMKGFKAALMSTGIGALVVAIGSLVAAFTTSEEGAARFRKIWMPITVLFDNVIDLLADVGESIISAFENPKEAIKSLWKLVKDNIVTRFEALGNLFTSLKDIGVNTFDLIGASIKNMWSDQSKEIAKAEEGIKNAAMNMGKAVLQATTGITDDQLQKTNEWLKQNNKEMKQAAALSDLIYKTDVKEREQTVKRAKVEAEIAELRLRSREVQNENPKEAIDYLEKSKKLQDDLLRIDLEIANARLAIQKEKNTYARSNAENLNKEAELEAKVFNVQAARQNSARQIQRELNTLTKSYKSDLESIEKSKETGLTLIPKIGDDTGLVINGKIKLDPNDFKQLDDYEKNIELNVKLNEEELKASQARADAFSYAVADSFYNLGTSITESLDFAESGLEGFISTLAETALQLISMMLAEALAAAIKGASIAAAFTGPNAVWTQPAFIATSVGGILSAFAAIPKFETGGIVGGSKYTGDNIIARVNSGEMILNKGQQANLFNMLNNNIDGGTVKFEIQGNTLVGVLNNHNKRMNNFR